ncbi:glycosyltransferase (type 1) [Vulcanisaeta moutnovskia 768-28]|uniref:Glycosyltransferase (Type 1) n=1 Tax=Vulcanisaeta moutnovskia (strain 768-28) TaxID=985053 RepID=F0QY52_VULM7|nr:glycosyltransferase family 4 protein [Vulcanisaeta moutnovskia]ADY01289.1 glycosyltransferase (type 1) [Vulcanisaeta moutnovskia 768-28]
MCRVLVVSEFWWPWGRGGVLATYLITRLLAVSGFEVRVVTGEGNPETIPGVSFVREPRLKVGDKLRLWVNAYLVSREGWFRRLVEWADVVYVPRYAYPVIPLAKALGKRVVVHLHDYQPVSYTATVFHNDSFRSDFSRTFHYELHEHGLMRALITQPLVPLNRLSAYWVSIADAVICVSKRQCEIVLNYLPGLRGRVSVVYNPLPEMRFLGKDLGNEPTFLYLSGASYVKGFNVLVKALELLGDKRYRVYMTRTINADALPGILRNKVVTVGEVPYSELPRLHHGAYALLFPSIWEEPLPYVVIESMLMGTLPIASRTGGVPEIVEGSPAQDYLFKSGNEYELADKIEKIISLGKEDVIEIGHRLREHVLRKFDGNTIKESLIKAFLR